MYQAGTIRRAGDDSGIYEVEAMRRDAETVIQKTIEDVLPMKAVREVLEEIALTKPVYVIAIGKAAWGMADEAARLLGSRIVEGIVVTKYGHSKGNIEGFQIMETAHPFPDDNSMLAAGTALSRGCCPASRSGKVSPKGKAGFCGKKSTFPTFPVFLAMIFHINSATANSVFAIRFRSFNLKQRTSPGCLFFHYLPYGKKDIPDYSMYRYPSH